MATKFVPKNGTINGTSKKDKITYSSSWSSSLTVKAGKSADIIDFKKSKYKNNKLYGNGGNDTIHGGKKTDYIYGGSGKDYLFGYNGNDLIKAGSNNDCVDGGNGDDKIWGNGGNNQLKGGYGNDTIYAGTGNDSIWGGYDNDAIDLSKGGKNVVYGGNGNDSIYGGTGNDYINGGIGNDTISALGANNTIYGGAGNDVITLKNANGFNINPEKGTDVIKLEGSSYGTIKFSRGDGNNTLYGIENINKTYTVKLDFTVKSTKNNSLDNSLLVRKSGDTEYILGSKKGNDLVIKLTNGETFTVKNYYVGNNKDNLSFININKSTGKAVATRLKSYLLLNKPSTTVSSGETDPSTPTEPTSTVTPTTPTPTTPTTPTSPTTPPSQTDPSDDDNDDGPKAGDVKPPVVRGASANMRNFMQNAPQDTSESDAILPQAGDDFGYQTDALKADVAAWMGNNNSSLGDIGGYNDDTGLQSMTVCYSPGNSNTDDFISSNSFG